MYDLTADVNFPLLQAACSKFSHVTCSKTITQSEFLHKLGIAMRVLLLKAKNPELQEKLDFQFNTLTSPTEMGVRFKFMCVATGNLPYPFESV